jgi:two-component system, OmpR family, sensor histidine kinase KdpD
MILRTHLAMSMHDHLSAIAHDLRAPLTVIAGTAAALRRTATDESQAALDKILHEAQRLGRMLENRLAAVRLQDDKPLSREWVAIEELAATALARLEALLADRQVEVAIGSDAIGHIDARLGELVISNLVDNAIRYSPATSSLLVAARRGDGEVLIDIEDAGPGLPPQVKLGDAELARGKGLAVCRAVAVAHGGALEIERREGGGTRVRVRIRDGAKRPEIEPEGGEG